MDRSGLFWIVSYQTRSPSLAHLVLRSVTNLGQEAFNVRIMREQFEGSLSGDARARSAMKGLEPLIACE
jgi:hypothetical protein